MIHELEVQARLFAARAHGDQKRKYTGEPYTVHTSNVADRVRTVPHTPHMLAAAHLHDVVEDTATTLDDLAREFPPGVVSLVNQLTDRYADPKHGSRSMRKYLERERLSTISQDAMTIKLADMLDNTHDIATHDPNFAKVYIPEMRLLLPMLRHGDRELWMLAAFAIGYIG